MTRMSGFKAVTRMLRGRRVRLTAGVPATLPGAGTITSDTDLTVVVGDGPGGAAYDLTVPEGVVVVLPAVEQRALDWDAPPTRAEQQSVTVLQPLASQIDVAVTVTHGTTPVRGLDAPEPGTQRASNKRRKGKRA